MSQQPTLFGTNERPKHRPVRETSRTAYQVGKAKWTGRKFVTAEILERYQRTTRTAPTSAELAVYATFEKLFPAILCLNTAGDRQLYIRRGLSDLSACGAVENPKGVDGKLLKRPCAVTGSMCFVWRVRQR